MPIRTEESEIVDDDDQLIEGDDEYVHKKVVPYDLGEDDEDED